MGDEVIERTYPLLALTHSGHRHWLVVEQQHDRNWGRFGHDSEQHSRPVSKHPRTQCLAKRLNIGSQGSRLGPSQVKEKCSAGLRGFFTAVLEQVGDHRNQDVAFDFHELKAQLRAVSFVHWESGESNLEVS